ncbi:MAG: AAA family ATPase, partial [Alphaproteobacteria bacterium]|nr:AAA family ATPase [Alphaproteobacteria bacterium]
SGVLADFLEQLIEIDGPGRTRRHRNPDLSATIERDVLGGTVRIDRSVATNYPRFAYRPDGWKDDLALANASSMVSELAPVVLYLRHLVRPDNVLIVEEPESHLHPAMQVAFTRQLATLVNAGIRVIVTTHSEWLLEELANIVQRSKIPKPKDASLVDDNVALRADQVGAWLFEPKLRPKGSVVREIQLDASGLYPAGYDAVAAALHNDWAELSSRIENGS